MRARNAIVCVLSGAFGDCVQIQVILHVRTHAWQVMHDVHAGRLQSVGGPDAGKLEKARRADSAAADDNLPVRVQCLGPGARDDCHPNGAAVLDFDLQRLGVEANRKILPALYRLHKSGGCGRSLGVAGRELVVADPVLDRAVEIVVEGNAEFLRGA